MNSPWLPSMASISPTEVDGIPPIAYQKKLPGLIIIGPGRTGVVGAAMGGAGAVDAALGATEASVVAPTQASSYWILLGHPAAIRSLRHNQDYSSP